MASVQCFALLLLAGTAAGHSVLRAQRLGHSRLPGVSIPVIGASESSSGAEKAFEIFRQMQNGQQPPPPLEGLSPACKGKLEEEHKSRTGLFGPPSSCEHTPCTFRMEFNRGGGSVSNEEGPACFPKECQNTADTTLFVSKFQDKIKAALDTVMEGCKKHYPDEPHRCPVQEGYHVHVEMDCSASGGAEKGAGSTVDGNNRISVDDDYVTDAKPLDQDAMLMTPPPVPKGKSGAGGAAEPPKYRSGTAALAPLAVALMATLASFAL